MALTRIALVGAGGNLGKFVVRELQKDSTFQLTIVTRQSTTSDFGNDLNVIKVDDDYLEDDLVKAFKGQDAVVAMINARAGASQANMINAAIKSGVKRFIPADFAGQAEDQKAAEVFPLVNGHIKIIDNLKSKESSGLTWTSIITGIWIDLAVPNKFMGFDFSNKAAKIWDSGDATFTTSTRTQVAKAVAQVLRKPEITKNRYLYIGSFTTSQNEILRSMERVTGGRWTTSNVKTSDMIIAGREGMKAGDFLKAGNLALSVTYGGEYGADFEKFGKFDNDLIDLPKEDLDTVIASLAPK